MKAFIILTRLQGRGIIRRMMGNFRKPVQAILTVLGIGLFGLIFLPAILFGSAGRADLSGESIRTLAPFFILLFFVTSLFAPKTVLFFTPAAVNFLFAGPFSCRAILGYRMVLGIGGAMASAVFVTAGLGMMIGSWGRAWLALTMIAVFVFLLNLIVTLGGIGLRAKFRPELVRTGMILLLGIIAMLAVSGAAEVDGPAFAAAVGEGAMTQAGKLLRASTLVSTLLKPFDFFGELLAARSDFYSHAAFAGMVCVALAALVLALPVDFREEAVRVSRRVDARRQKAERGEFSIRGSRYFRPVLPLLPWGAAGAILWRQLQGGLRRLPGMLGLGLIAAAPGFFILFRSDLDDGAGIGMVVAPLVFLTIFMASSGLTCDFRSDLKQMEVLKALPARPIAIAGGQLAAPVVVLTFAQAILLGAFSLLVTAEFRPILWAALVGLLPANLILIALENLGILLFPTQYRNVTTDPMAMMRMIVFGALKVLVFGLLLFVLGGGAFLVFMLTESVWAAGIFGSTVAVGACVLLVWAVSAAFDQFDPGSAET